MDTITRLEAVWLLPGRERWEQVRALRWRAPALVDGYLAQPRLTCCSFQGGFFIDVGGRPWSDEGTVDEPWMTVTWFNALVQLLGAEQAEAGATPWEESRLRLRRDGERVVLEDVHHSGAVSMPRVELPFAELAARLVAEGEALAALIGALRAEAARRAPAGPEQAEALATIASQLPDNGPDSLGLIAEAGRLLGLRAPR